MSSPKKPYVAAVERIYDEVKNLGYQTENQRSWVIRKVGTGSHLHIGTSTNELYEGHGGIAVFLALVSKCLDIQDARKLAIEAVTSLLSRNVDPVDIGIGRGIGGYIYALLTVGTHVCEPRLVDAAVELAEGVTSEDIASDSAYDIMQGSAGLLLALLALFQERSHNDLLDGAIKCGDHLLNSRIHIDDEIRAWATGADGTPLVGFSHGSAGIAYALARLYDTTGEVRFKRAAIAALDYERTQFSTAANNWRDHRDETEEFADSWCHGRAGICLGRSRTNEFLSTDFAPSVSAAVDALTQVEAKTDQLCCGNAGLVDTLIGLGYDRHETRAYELGHNIIEKQSFSLPAHGRSLFNPTLFQGASGIGYICLRLAFPDDVPCLLLVE